MPYGLQVFNTDGTTVTIDQDYKNLSLSEKGSFATTSALGPANASQGTFTRTGLTNPILVIAHQTRYCWGAVFDQGGGTFRFQLVNGGPTSGSSVGELIPYYIFDTVKTAQASAHYGLQVFAADGSIVFDSGVPAMNVVDFVATTFVQSARTYTAGRQYAAAINKTAFSISYQAGNKQIQGIQCPVGSIQFGGIICDSQPASPPTINAGTGNVMIVDVTNF